MHNYSKFGRELHDIDNIYYYDRLILLFVEIKDSQKLQTLYIYNIIIKLQLCSKNLVEAGIKINLLATHVHAQSYNIIDDYNAITCQRLYVYVVGYYESRDIS